jgi:7-cyano-7-deazaguanine synthase in queuosine biosynthesis
MSRHFVFACDGAAVPRQIEGLSQAAVRRINSDASSDDLTLRAEPVGETLLGDVPARIADLVHIAALAYAADQETSRGGPRDVHGDEWRRRLTLVVPVADPDFWRQDHVQTGLSDALQFLTDDEWEFHFQPARRGGTRNMRLGIANADRPPEAVVLLSGGADSLCAALEAATVHGLRPLLVSHRSTTYLGSRQTAVARGLMERLGGSSLPHVSFLVNRRGRDPSDTSQRSRGFLFASLGAAAASDRGSPQVRLADNGVVSVNLPITRQLLGAMASRATHPKFIWRFNRLLQYVVPSGPRLVNPFWDRTRKDTLEILKAAGAEPLLAETRSCSHLRGQTRLHPQCGGCYQCVDRRFAVIAAGLEAHDPVEQYGLDIFTHTLPEGEPRTTALSYVQFAQDLVRFEIEELFNKYSELPECILPDDPRTGETATFLGEMLQRHARSICGAIEAMVARYSKRLATRSLPDSLPDQCMIRLAVGARSGPSQEAELPSNQFLAAAGVRRITFGNRRADLRDSAGLRQLAHLLGTPGQSRHVRELMALEVTPRDETELFPDYESDRLESGDLSIQEVADETTLTAVAGRVRELEQARNVALESDDEEHLKQIEEEMEKLRKYLASAQALAGRPRTFTTDDERARKAVSKNISRALGALQKVHPPLAAHLRESLSLGFVCTYRPVPSIDWTI